MHTDCLSSRNDMAQVGGTALARWRRRLNKSEPKFENLKFV